MNLTIKNFFQAPARLFKKDRGILIILLALALALLPSTVGSGNAAATTLRLLLDGSANGGCTNSTSSCSATLTTQNGGDVIIVFAIESLDSQVSCKFTVTDSGTHSWSARSTNVFDQTGRSQMQEFWAESSTPLASDIVTESISGCGTNYNSLLVFAISGANLNSPFDPNSSLPGTANGNSGNTSVAISTTNPSDMIFAAVTHGNAAASPTPAQGFAVVTTTGLNVAEYATVNSTATNMAVTFNDAASADWISIADAVQSQTPLPPPVLTANPSNGIVGTKVLVLGSSFPVQFGQSEVLITFDDQLIGFGFTSDGTFNFTFNVPVAQPGAHIIKATEPSVTSNSLLVATTTFQVLPTTASSFSVSVTSGTIYFPGESASISVIVTQNGKPTTISDLTLTILVISPAGSMTNLKTTVVQSGVYSTNFTLSATSPTGTYAIIVNAISPSLGADSAITSFLLKPAWVSSHATTPTMASVLFDLVASHATALSVGLTWVGLVTVIGVASQRGHLRKSNTSSNKNST